MIIYKKGVKMKKDIYIYNVTILAIIGFLFIVPLITPKMVEIAPNLMKCPYEEATGEPCVLCGMTTDVYWI